MAYTKSSYPSTVLSCIINTLHISLTSQCSRHYVLFFTISEILEKNTLEDVAVSDNNIIKKFHIYVFMYPRN